MKNILKYYVAVVMFLMPVFILPVVTGAYGFGKSWFLGAAGLLGLVFWLVEVLTGKKKVKGSKVFGFMFLLVLLAFVSWMRMPVGVRVRSLQGPLGFGTVVALAVWVFLWVQVQSKKEFSRQFNFLSVAGGVVALMALGAFLLPESKLPLNFPKENPLISVGVGWSITGSLQVEAMLFLFLLAEWLRRFLRKIKDRGGAETRSWLLEAGAVAFFALMTFLDGYRLFKTGWLAMDGLSSWVVAVETLKTSPLFGVGVGNFLQAFLMYRPASYNLTAYWSSAFLVSKMGFLQLWTEMGLGGLGLVFLAIKFWWGQKKVWKGAQGFDFWRLGIFLGMVFLLPMNLLAVWLLLWLISGRLVEAGEGGSLLTGLELKKKEGGEVDLGMILRIGMAVLVGGMVIWGGYWWTRILMGEIYLRKSFVAMSQNNAEATFNWQIKAMQANPSSAEYRRYYSQTNLSLALSLLTVGEGEQVSEENKQNASTLIQQAVTEAKAAVNLDSRNASYWTNLAVIYKALAGMVDGAADWSLEAYRQAVALNPVDPLLKLDLGSLLFAGGSYEAADRAFEEVVVSKQDFANGWYNWAHNAKKMDRLADAVARLSQAVALVPVDSGDYEKASGELMAWRKELDEAIKKQKELLAQQQAQAEKKPETFVAPEPMPTVQEEERVNVPAEDLEPPPEVVTPTEEP
ncbi:hypothetical protein KJ909_00275 [Patescibacteria group bacterium]|nr:hypothetical protein [Patescibacteria group bacterium]